jgi:hypothetical protein
MIPNRATFAVCFSELPRPVEDVWETITTLLRAGRCLPKKLSMSQVAGHREELHSRYDLVLCPDEISQVITDRELTGFHIHTGHSEKSIRFWLLDIQNEGNPANLTVRIESKTKTPPNWNELIEALLFQWQTIGAWQWNNLYEAWQNAGNPESYERNFGIVPPSAEHFEMPGTFEPRQRIRLQNAPGRIKSMLPGIDFHPSAEMWLGPHFWQYAKCTKEEAMASDFFLEVRDTPHFLYLKSWPHPFTRPDGEQGLQQQRLWKLFFHEDCEWPPGSGTICDEPMYGPPELMPDQA